MKTIEFEGFIDTRPQDSDGFFMAIVKPGFRDDEPGSLSIDGLIEDVCLDISLGDNPYYDHPEFYNMNTVKRYFRIARKAFEAGESDKCKYAYFKVTCQIFTEDEKSGEVYRIIDYQGVEELRLHLDEIEVKP